MLSFFVKQKNDLLCLLRKNPILKGNISMHTCVLLSANYWKKACKIWLWLNLLLSCCSSRCYMSGNFGANGNLFWWLRLMYLCSPSRELAKTASREAIILVVYKCLCLSKQKSVNFILRNLCNFLQSAGSDARPGQHFLWMTDVGLATLLARDWGCTRDNCHTIVTL